MLAPEVFWCGLLQIAHTAVVVPPSWCQVARCAKAVLQCCTGWRVCCRGKPRVYSMHNYPITLNQTDIKAGKCIVHSINMVSEPTAWYWQSLVQQPSSTTMEADSSQGHGQYWAAAAHAELRSVRQAPFHNHIGSCP